MAYGINGMLEFFDISLTRFIINIRNLTCVVTFV